ncbi:MAG: CRISPR system precrRNA processing endoribonuclease RAMP protein Cas6 [Leptolyngbya sp. SIO4C1]|nr:CRISPR system precrRNA processing endoribonuclease RAMP protein Cas6 [Leptolyngbya sp. SIO4C1]
MLLPKLDNLYAIAIQIAAAQSGPLSANLNQAVHAQVMNWFSLADPEVGSNIHNAQISPIAISGLLGRRRAKNMAKAGDLFTIRVSLLQGSLLSILLAGLEESQSMEPLASISLDRFPFKVKQILAMPGSNQLVGSAQYSLLAQLPHPGQDLTLRLVSPTSFRQQGYVQPFPVTQTVFGGLLKRWNHFTPERFAWPPIEWTGFVTGYELKTRSVYLKNSPQLGAEGIVSYRFPDSKQARLAHCLAQFSYFAGIGRKTSMGMGQTRLKT